MTPSHFGLDFFSVNLFHFINQNVSIRALHSSPKEVHIDLPQFSWWPWPIMGSELFCYFAGMTYPQTFQDCKRTVLSFDTGSFASYSQDQLTKLKWSGVGVGDLGISENEGDFHVHFFWRRVYINHIDN